ncbi:hypothetical protein [Bartonella sp. DGB1]|uniref:hypothetical protein n=1 Tax=Bartonella sp. DGB1 TaxID=3239807 RepID=UPI0035244D39
MIKFKQKNYYRATISKLTIIKKYFKFINLLYINLTAINRPFLELLFYKLPKSERISLPPVYIKIEFLSANKNYKIKAPFIIDND